MGAVGLHPEGGYGLDQASAGPRVRRVRCHCHSKGWTGKPARLQAVPRVGVGLSPAAIRRLSGVTGTAGTK